ncbi:MAG: hypothetical protein HY903_01525 [Deltaproteobacteria bacterium]|nr:hypothetical protein [Deltaproteobacteria bacterium]
MVCFNGRAFLLGIEHLDRATQQLFEHPPQTRDGRWALVDRLVDEAMARMVGADLQGDPDGVDSKR